MPTGYTAAIIEGDGTDFPSFALSCARAFGALITMRDDAPDAPIPDSFPVDDYHERARERAVAELLDLAQMTDDECRIAAQQEYVEALARHRELLCKQAEDKRRYEEMLDKALAWNPPTDDHAELKAFMVEQIQQSIRFDTTYQWPEPQKKSHAEWRADKHEKAERDVEYHEKEHAKAVERADGRSAWVQQLKASLPDE